MPKGRYTVGGKGTHGCKGYPVVGDTGKVHGCHTTRESAQRQQAAIYAATAKLIDPEPLTDEELEKANSLIPDDVEKAQGPCWDGYEMVGYKTVNGKKVPNCVPVSNKSDDSNSDNDDENGEDHDKKKKKKKKSEFWEGSFA